MAAIQTNAFSQLSRTAISLTLIPQASQPTTAAPNETLWLKDGVIYATTSSTTSTALNNCDVAYVSERGRTLAAGARGTLIDPLSTVTEALTLGPGIVDVRGTFTTGLTISEDVKIRLEGELGAITVADGVALTIEGGLVSGLIAVGTGSSLTVRDTFIADVQTNASAALVIAGSSSAALSIVNTPTLMTDSEADSISLSLTTGTMAFEFYECRCGTVTINSSSADPMIFKAFGALGPVNVNTVGLGGLEATIDDCILGFAGGTEASTTVTRVKSATTVGYVPDDPADWPEGVPVEAADALDKLAARGSGGSGDVVGPASATDNAIVRFDGTTGKLIQSSSVTISDAGNLDTAGVIQSDTLAPHSAGSLSIESPSGSINLIPDIAVEVTAGQGIYTTDLKGPAGALTALVNGVNPLDCVVGPASATDNAIARFDGTTGKLAQNSVVTLSDTGDLAGVSTINGAAPNASSDVYFGQGSAPITYSVNTALTASVMATDITIDPGVTLSTRGFELYATGTLTIGAGAIVDCGSGDASGSTGGIAYGGTVIPSTNGGTGIGTTISGTVYGGVGGAGGAGSGGAGGAMSATALGSVPLRISIVRGISNMAVGSQGGISGSAGGGGGVGNISGGAGGATGKLLIAASTITGSGTIRGDGGKGGNAPGVNAGGGGGAGGGVIMLIYRQLSGFNPATQCSVLGGAGGLGNGTGANGAAGTNGAVVQWQLP